MKCDHIYWLIPMTGNWTRWLFPYIFVSNVKSLSFPCFLNILHVRNSQIRSIANDRAFFVSYKEEQLFSHLIMVMKKVGVFFFPNFSLLLKLRQLIYLRQHFQLFWRMNKLWRKKKLSSKLTFFLWVIDKILGN